MMLSFVLCFIIILTSTYVAYSATIRLDKAYPCSSVADQVIKVDLQIKKTWKNSSHLVDLLFNTPMDIHNNTYVTAEVGYSISGATWVSSPKITDINGGCNFYNFYLNNLWFDIEQAIGVTPKKCPIPKGTHRVSNYILDLRKMQIAVAPPGKYRITYRFFEKGTKKVLTCNIVEALRS